MVVRVYWLLDEDRREKDAESQEVRIPPLEPVASRTVKSLKWGGRKVAVLNLSMALSLVSWMQMMVGWAAARVSRTRLHLWISPSP